MPTRSLGATPNSVHCGFWAVGALVGDPGGDGPPIISDRRAIWLTEIQIPCGNNAEMNGDGVVNETDLLLYSKLHAAGDPLADMNQDSKVDAFDYLIYTDEYLKRPK